MDKRDSFEELFQKGLQNHGSPVNERIWENVSSNLVSSTSAGFLGSGAFKTILFVSLTAVSIVTGLLVYSSNKEKEPAIIEDKTESFKTTEVRTEVQDSLLPIEENISATISYNNNNRKESNKNHSVENTQQGSDKLPVEDPKMHKVQPVLIVQERAEELENDSSAASEDDNSQEQILSQNQEVQTKTQIEKTESNIDLLLPNIFTPNNDGSNDYFELNLEELHDISFVVMDQDGNIVYTSNKTSIQWNGNSMLGDKLPPGTYLYIVTGKDKEEKMYKAYSNLDLRY